MKTVMQLSGTQTIEDVKHFKLVTTHTIQPSQLTPRDLKIVTSQIACLPLDVEFSSYIGRIITIEIYINIFFSQISCLGLSFFTSLVQ